MVYVGDRNAFNEIVEDNQKLKNEVVYSKVEIDRLNNIIKELSKDVDMWNKKYNEQFDIINELESYLEQQWLEWKDDYDDGIVAMANEDKSVLDKLKELKNGDNNE